MNPKSPVFLDMDPGIDDALALTVAFARLPVAGLMTVAGNVAGEKTFRNAGKLLRVLGRTDVPLLRGSDHPLFYPLHTASSVHGETGLDGFDLRDAIPLLPSSPLPSWIWLARKIARSFVPVTLIPTGPLTNIARFLLAFPHLISNIGSINFMGGAIRGGNVTSTAEFNFYVDPDAAQVVLDSQVPLRMIGLDVTQKARMPTTDIDRLREYGYPGRMLAGFLTFYSRRLNMLKEVHDSVAIHDAVAVCAADRPDLFLWESYPLKVVREGSLRGTVVLDPKSADRTPVAVARDIDTQGFLEWFWASMDSQRQAFLSRYREDGE